MKNWYSEILTGNHACTYSHVTDSYPGTVRYSQATILLGNHACSHSHITDSYPGTVGYSQVTTPAFTPIIHTHTPWYSEISTGNHAWVNSHITHNYPGTA